MRPFVINFYCSIQLVSKRGPQGLVVMPGDRFAASAQHQRRWHDAGVKGTCARAREMCLLLSRAREKTDQTGRLVSAQVTRRRSHWNEPQLCLFIGRRTGQHHCLPHLLCCIVYVRFSSTTTVIVIAKESALDAEGAHTEPEMKRNDFMFLVIGVSNGQRCFAMETGQRLPASYQIQRAQ